MLSHGVETEQKMGRIAHWQRLQNHSYRPTEITPIALRQRPWAQKVTFPYTFLAFCIRAGQPRTAASKGEPWVGPGLAYKWPGLAWLISGLAWPGV